MRHHIEDTNSVSSLFRRDLCKFVQDHVAFTSSVKIKGQLTFYIDYDNYLENEMAILIEENVIKNDKKVEPKDDVATSTFTANPDKALLESNENQNYEESTRNNENCMPNSENLAEKDIVLHESDSVQQSQQENKVVLSNEIQSSDLLLDEDKHTISPQQISLQQNLLLKSHENSMLDHNMFELSPMLSVNLPTLKCIESSKLISFDDTNKALDPCLQSETSFLPSDIDCDRDVNQIVDDIDYSNKSSASLLHPCFMKGCTLAFDSADNLIAHIGTVHEYIQTNENDISDENNQSASNQPNKRDMKNRFICPYCPLSFKTKVVFDNHTQSKHLKKWQISRLHEYRCMKCPFIAADKDALKKHEKIHDLSYSAKEAYQCTNCSYKTDKLALFHNHKATKHNFRCHLCPFVGVKRPSLANHVKTFHFPKKKEKNRYDFDIF